MPEESLLKPLVKKHPGSKTVYFVHGLKGHVLAFRPLARKLTPRWATEGILYPVFVRPDVQAGSFEDLVSEIRESTEIGQEPVILVGYSIGGAVAFEMAHQLHQRGHKASVVLLDTSIPKLRRERKRYGQAIQSFFGQSYRKLRRRYRRLSAPSSPDPGEQKFEWAENFEKEKRKRIEQYFDNFKSALLNYQPSKSGVDVYLLKIDEADHRLVRQSKYRPSADYGWSDVANVVGIAQCPGDHFSLFEDGYRSQLAPLIDNALGELSSRNMQPA